MVAKGFKIRIRSRTPIAAAIFGRARMIFLVDVV
jgi:hypothetical protein